MCTCSARSARATRRAAPEAALRRAGSGRDAPDRRAQRRDRSSPAGPRGRAHGTQRKERHLAAARGPEQVARARVRHRRSRRAQQAQAAAGERAATRIRAGAPGTQPAFRCTRRVALDQQRASPGRIRPGRRTPPGCVDASIHAPRCPLDIRISLCQLQAHGRPARRTARLRRADPAAAARAGRARRVLRHRFHRDPRPVAAAPVAPSAAALRGRAAGAGARGRQCLVRAARPPDAPGRWSRALLARLPEDDPVLAADRRQAARVLAERARAASESFRRTGRRLGRDARARPAGRRRSRRRCSRCCRAGALGRLLDIGTGTGRLLELLAPRVDDGAGRGRQPGDAGAGPRPAGARRAWRIAPCGWPTCTACRCRTPAFDVVRAADGAALRRGPGRRAGRGRARAAARRPLIVVDLAAHDQRRVPRPPRASLARILRRARCATCSPAPGLPPAPPVADRRRRSRCACGRPSRPGQPPRHPPELRPGSDRRYMTRPHLLDALRDRVLLCDGGMGSRVQALHARRRARLLGPRELHRGAEPFAPRPGARHPSRLFRGRRRHGGDQQLRRLAGHARRVRPGGPRVRDQPAGRRTGARGRRGVRRWPAPLGDRQHRAGHQAAEPRQHRLRPAGGGAGRAVPRPDRRRRRRHPDRDLPGHAADQGGGERRQARPRRGRHATRRSSCR